MIHYFLISLIILCFELPFPLFAAEPPHLLIEAPATLSPLSTRVQNIDKARIQTIMNLVGVEHQGNPIRVLVAPEQSDWARQAPSWVSGYAISEQDLIVLLPERVISYPYDSFDSLFEHELAHILIGRAAGGQSVPRWFDEGLAMVAAHSWNVEDRARLVWAMVMEQPISLPKLAQLFHQDEASVHQAYVLSHALTRYCLQQFGDDWPKQTLNALAHGSSFEQAIFLTTSLSLEQVQANFWDSQSLWTRWVPVVTSSLALWIGILGLVFYVFKKQRQRAEAVKRQWKEDDWDF